MVKKHLTTAGRRKKNKERSERRRERSVSESAHPAMPKRQQQPKPLPPPPSIGDLNFKKKLRGYAAVNQKDDSITETGIEYVELSKNYDRILLPIEVPKGDEEKLILTEIQMKEILNYFQQKAGKLQKIQYLFLSKNNPIEILPEIDENVNIVILIYFGEKGTVILTKFDIELQITWQFFQRYGSNNLQIIKVQQLLESRFHCTFEKKFKEDVHKRKCSRFVNQPAEPHHDAILALRAAEEIYFIGDPKKFNVFNHDEERRRYRELYDHMHTEDWDERFPPTLQGEDREMQISEYNMQMAEQEESVNASDRSIEYEYPDLSYIKKCCVENFSLQFERQSYAKFLKKIRFNQISVDSKPDVSVPTKDESGFGGISVLFTGAEDNADIIRKKINQKFTFYMSQDDENFDGDKIAEVIKSPVMLLEHLETLCRWMECRVMVYCNGTWEKYGIWDSGDLPLFVLEKKPIKEKSIYQVILSLNDEIVLDD